MFKFITQIARPLAAAAVLGVLALTACDTEGLLDVDDPDIVTEEQLAGPSAVPLAIAGIIGDFQEAYDDYVRYAALFTDEMILAGTFPTRIDVDERNVIPTNGTVTDELYEPLQVALVSADTARAIFSAGLGDPEFEDVQDLLREGIARANYYSAYTRLILAELYCQSVVHLRDPVDSDTRMQEALDFFVQAEAAAVEAGLPDLAIAAQVGQARAQLWLGNYPGAAALAAEVPSEFVYVANYSANQNQQGNEIFQFSYGVVEQLRWTIGDGTSGNRHNERWAYLDEWIELGLVLPTPEGLEAVEIGIPVFAETLYDQATSDILLASGWEADMIQAEFLLRSGQAEAAEDLVNSRLIDPSTNPMRVISGGAVPTGAFEPVDFTGTLSSDLRQLARARAAGLWLTGQRQATSRRFIEDGVNLYPDGTLGDDVCFPIPEQETVNNAPGDPNA